jgi:hypothetical protein
MTLLHRLASIVRWMVRRNQAECDLNDEMEAFVDMAAADQIRDGATPAEAQRRATLQLGGLDQAKERVRGGRHGAWLDVAGRDVRYGLRQVRRNPAFSAIAIATLALGIGGMTAMFSAFDAVLIRALPYTDADRLVMIWDATGETGLVLAAIASRFMSALLYGFRPDYITTVAVVSVILVGVAALASVVPARRAARIDPMMALRQE